MREVTDEALQRLYWACRSRSGFPGEPLDESNGNPSTTEILDALGLMRPSLEDLGGPETLLQHVNSSDISAARPSQHARSPSSATSHSQDDYLPSPTQSSFSMSPVHSLNSGPAPITTNSASTIPATPPEMDMSEQFQYAASAHSSSHRSSTSNGEIYTNLDNSANMNFDLDTYLDTSSCTIPPNVTHPNQNMHNSSTYDMSAMMDRSGAVCPRDRASLPAIPFLDSYLTPWPGSLAATYNTVDRNVSLAI